MFQLSGNMVSNPSRHRTTNRCCTNPKGAFRADRARGGTIPNNRCVSEPDPIDEEFERALDQELDTIAEDDLKLRLHLRSRMSAANAKLTLLSRISCAKKRSVNANNARLKHSNIRMNLPLIRMNPHLILSPRKAGTSTQSWSIWTKCTKIRHQMPASRRDLLPDIEEINSTLRGIKNQRTETSQKHRRKKMPLVGVGFAWQSSCCFWRLLSMLMPI